MKSNGFVEFVDKKSRDAKHELRLVKEVLKKSGFKTEETLEGSDPFVFVYAPDKSNLSFDGVRIYKIGDALAFRVQKEAKTHPYGRAYLLDVEEMYNDLLSDKMDEAKAGKHVMEAVVKEMQSFFKKSGEAEKEINQGSKEDSYGRVIMGSSGTGTDYSSTVFDKTT